MDPEGEALTYHNPQRTCTGLAKTNRSQGEEGDLPRTKMRDEMASEQIKGKRRRKREPESGPPENQRAGGNLDPKGSD